MAEAWHDALLAVPATYVEVLPSTKVNHAMAKQDIVGPPACIDATVAKTVTQVDWPRQRLEVIAKQGPFQVLLVAYCDTQEESGSWRHLAEGQEIKCQGVIQNWNGQLMMQAPIIMPNEAATMYPIYKVDGHEQWLRTQNALARLATDMKDLVAAWGAVTEQDLLDRLHLKTQSLTKVLLAAHRPSTMEEGLRGRKALLRLQRMVMELE